MSKNKVSHIRIIEVSPIMSYGQSFKSKSSDNYLIHRDILRLQLSQKQGTVSTKTRSEVRGGGKKPWRQKGTGRARAGSSRSPLWKGGGVIFGPKPKTVSLKVNKKERQRAFKALLFNRFQQNNVILIDDGIFENGRTKKFSQNLYTDIEKFASSYKFQGQITGGDRNFHENEKILIIVPKKTEAQKLATRNIKNIELISVLELNTLSLLKAKRVLMVASLINHFMNDVDPRMIFCDKYDQIRHKGDL